MKHKPLLRLFALICIVASSFGLPALRSHHKIASSCEQPLEESSNTDSENTQNEVMNRESLSRHILPF